MSVNSILNKITSTHPNANQNNSAIKKPIAPKLDYASGNQAMAHLTDKVGNQFSTDDEKTQKTPMDFLRQVLEKQPVLIDDENLSKVPGRMKFDKPADEMTRDEYNLAFRREVYGQAMSGYQMSDEDIRMADKLLINAKLYKTDYNLMGTMDDLRASHKAQTSQMDVTIGKENIEYARRAGQAVMQFRQYEAARNTELDAEATEKTKQMFIDPLRLGGNFAVRWLEKTLNTPRDLMKSHNDSKLISLPGSSQIEEAARAGFRATTGAELPAIPTKGEVIKAVTGMDAPEIPEVKLPRPFEYQSDKYKKDGKTGEEVGATILDLLLLKRGMSSGAKSPESLKGLGGIPKVKATTVVPKTSSVKPFSELFNNNRVPKASELKNWAETQGWTLKQNPNGPLKYIDENNITRLTIKKGSPRAAGSGFPHVEIKNAAGQRVDAFGNPVTRKSVDNHTLIDYDL